MTPRAEASVYFAAMVFGFAVGLTLFGYVGIVAAGYLP